MHELPTAKEFCDFAEKNNLRIVPGNEGLEKVGCSCAIPILYCLMEGKELPKEKDPTFRRGFFYGWATRKFGAASEIWNPFDCFLLEQDQQEESPYSERLEEYVKEAKLRQLT